MSDDQINKIISIMMLGMTAEAAAKQAGFAEDQAPAAIAAARNKLATLAGFNRDEELTLAKRRLEELFKLARAAKDLKVAATVQKELNKLMDLYRPMVVQVDHSRSTEELEAVRKHLLPLNLVPDTAGTEEMARMAVARIVELQGKP